MFPFKKLSFEDKESIEQFTSQFDPYSDFNFTSLWSYNTSQDTEIYLDDNCFIVKFPDYITNVPIYSFLSRTNQKNILYGLFEHMRSEGVEQKIHLLPEISLSTEIQTDPNVIVEEDRDNFDYIMHIPEVVSLESTLYKYKRRHIHQFLSHHPTHEVNVTSGRNKMEQDYVLRLFHLWAQSKTDRDTSHERIALTRLLEATNKIDVLNVTVWDQGSLVGFAFVETLGKYSIGSFMKADGQYEYIYDMLYHQCAIALHKLGCTYLNYEQDLGILPMREAKMHWHPNHFLKKYTVKLVK